MHIVAGSFIHSISMKKRLVISGTGCALADNLYTDIDFSRSQFRKYLSKENADGYQPEVVVSTKKLDKSIEIIVSDNGDGIPEQVRDKIFQPFFTTKPTGSGTGLGLSLSYDIVNAHVGELKVQSEDGKRTEFIIQLPIV